MSTTRNGTTVKASDWKILEKFGVTPDNLSVGGWLFLNRTSITALPDNLSVGGSLYLRHTSITALPDNLRVGRSLNLNYTPITALPDNLSVGGSLFLEGTRITALPDNFSVGGSLDLSYTPITALPDNLSVGGSLFLEGTRITVLFEDDRGYKLYCAGRRYIAGCRNFSVKEALAHWGASKYPDRVRGGKFCEAILKSEEKQRSDKEAALKFLADEGQKCDAIDLIEQIKQDAHKPIAMTCSEENRND